MPAAQLAIRGCAEGQASERFLLQSTNTTKGINPLLCHSDDRPMLSRISRKRIDRRNRVVLRAGVEVFGIQRIDPGFDASGDQQAIPMG